MKAVIVALTLILISQTISSDESSYSYRLLTVGVYHGDEVAPVEDDDWYGLFKVDSTYELRTVSVQTRKAVDWIVDDEGDTTGVEVIVDRPEEPLFLVQTSKHLPVGGIPTEHGEWEPFKLGEPICFSDRCLAELGEVTDEGESPGSLLIKRLRVVLYNHPRSQFRQTLFEHPGVNFDGTPSLLWVGDLDGDRELDFLLNTTNHYNVTNLALYLSSEAGDGEIVKLVATFRTTGC